MLLNKIRNMKDDEGGFTLIELLVVILIIGILAAVALPTFLNQASKGADAAAKSDLRSSSTKVEACAVDNGYAACLASSGDNSIRATLPSNVGVVGTATDSTYTLATKVQGKASSLWKITGTAGGSVEAPSTTTTAGT